MASLTILSLATAAIIAFKPKVSPILALNRMASSLIESAASSRHSAVLNGHDVLWQEDIRDCEGQALEINFYADGSADPAQICITHEDRVLRLNLLALSGQLVLEAE